MILSFTKELSVWTLAIIKIKTAVVVVTEVEVSLNVKGQILLKETGGRQLQKKGPPTMIEAVTDMAEDDKAVVVVSTSMTDPKELEVATEVVLGVEIEETTTAAAAAVAMTDTAAIVMAVTVVAMTDMVLLAGATVMAAIDMGEAATETTATVGTGMETEMIVMAVIDHTEEATATGTEEKAAGLQGAWSRGQMTDMEAVVDQLQKNLVKDLL